MNNETWRSIPGFVGYEASDAGRVRSVDRYVNGRYGLRFIQGRVLAPAANDSGHLSVVLGRGNTKAVHAVVMLAFRGPTPPGFEILHRDHQPNNNRLDNLRFGTRTENLLHDYESGSQRCAVRVKVTFPDGRHEIFSNSTRAAKALGVSQPAVSVALRDGSTFRKTKARVERHDNRIF